MNLIRAFLLCALAASLPAHAAADDDEGWNAFGHALSLAQMFVRIAAQSDNPSASQKAIDDMLAGRNGEANRAFSGLLDDVTAGMPSEQRDKMASIGRDLAALARKEAQSTGVSGVGAGAAPNVDRALQARKDLTAMGLRYFDAEQFRDAVRRDDALAVELYLAGRGVNVESRGSDGRSPLDIARANGNEGLAQQLSRNLPAKR